MGQTPALKAAKAARGQQPKKWSGRAQREAIKRAQAAKKPGGRKSTAKTAAKKTTAKKAVPLPRGPIRAAYPGTCPACFQGYGKGEVITKVSEGWGHPGCAPRHLSAAEREFARNKARIESGETFRAQKSSDWRRGASPSSTRPARCPGRQAMWRQLQANTGQGEIGHLSVVTVRRGQGVLPHGGSGPYAHRCAGRTNRRPGHQAGESEDTMPAPDRPAPSHPRCEREPEHFFVFTGIAATVICHRGLVK